MDSSDGGWQGTAVSVRLAMEFSSSRRAEAGHSTDRWPRRLAPAQRRRPGRLGEGLDARSDALMCGSRTPSTC